MLDQFAAKMFVDFIDILIHGVLNIHSLHLYDFHLLYSNGLINY